MLVNGLPSDSVSISDRGLLYGDGVFETILCEGGRPILLAGHTQRLENGCKRLGLPKQDLPTILSDIREVAKQDDCIVKVIITRGVQSRGYSYDQQDDTSARIVSRNALPKIPLDNYQRGIHLKKCEYLLPENTQLAGIKHLNRLDQVIARSEWESSFQEGVMLASDSRVVEGTMTNIFIEIDRKWVTPILDRSGIKGVMRQWIMRNSYLADIECVEKDIQLSEFKNANAIFVCNSVIGIWPVVEFEGQTYQVSDHVRNIMQQANSTITNLYPV